MILRKETWGSCLFGARLSPDESLNSLVLFLSICHMVKALLYFLVNGINKHFLDFSKGSLLQTPLKTSAIRQQRGLCLPDSWKTQNMEMLFVPQAVLNIVTRFHSLAWCVYWLVRDKTIIFSVVVLCIQIAQRRQAECRHVSLLPALVLPLHGTSEHSRVSTDRHCDWRFWDSWSGLPEAQNVSDEQMSSCLKLTGPFRSQPLTFSLVTQSNSD